MSGFADYENYDGIGLAALVRTRAINPVDLVEEAIRRIEALNPQLNAVIHPMYEIARAAAQAPPPGGAFSGVPFLLKDLAADYAGVPTRSGSRFHNDYVPDHDSEITRRYKAAGLIVVGKTNTPEYGLVPVTEPELFGPTCNPWDPERTPGGSSGGSAAAVAAGIVPIAHGNDGGGSIRIPASCCGLFGLKPTRGRNPLGPDLGESWHGLAGDHVLTRSVRDSAAMLDATAGPDVGAPYYAPPPARPFIEEVGADPGRLRIAFTSAPLLPGRVHDDCIAGLEATVALCEDLGHDLVEAAPPIDGEAFARAFLTLIFSATRAEIEEAENAMECKARATDFEPATWAVALLGRRIGAAAFSRAIRDLQRMGRRIGRFFADYDVLLTPTLGSPPVLTGALQPKPLERFVMKWLGRVHAGALISAFAGVEELAGQVFEFVPFTPVFNATGQPAMSVPLHWNAAGLPIGMHFVGRYGDEATLLRLAAQLERARAWHHRRPPIRLQA